MDSTLQRLRAVCAATARLLFSCATDINEDFTTNNVKHYLRCNVALYSYDMAKRPVVSNSCFHHERENTYMLKEQSQVK